jgi:hypothetical protein
MIKRKQTVQPPIKNRMRDQKPGILINFIAIYANISGARAVPIMKQSSELLYALSSASKRDQKSVQ